MRYYSVSDFHKTLYKVYAEQRTEFIQIVGNTFNVSSLLSPQ